MKKEITVVANYLDGSSSKETKKDIKEVNDLITQAFALRSVKSVEICTQKEFSMTTLNESQRIKV